MAEEKKFLGTAGVQQLITSVRSEIGTAEQNAKDYADSLADNYDAAGTATTKVKELADGQVKTNTDAIEKLNGDDTVEGSVDKKIADAKTELNQSISAVEEKADAAQADADALETDMGDVDTLSTNNKTVVGAINEVLAAVGTGGTAAVVTITTDTTTEGALKSYTVKQGNTTIGVIDIPKDMVVESGEVVTNPEGQPEGTYIKMVLANVAEPLYVNVGTLVDIYKPQENADQVQLAINSATREISATIVEGSITNAMIANVSGLKIVDDTINGSKLANNTVGSDKIGHGAIHTVNIQASAVTTAKIADENVTKDKLSSDVKSAINKAHTHSNKTLLDTYTQTEADLADAVTKKHEHVNKDVLDGITATQVSNWDAAHTNNHTHSNKDVLDGITSAKVTAWDAAEGNAKTYAESYANDLNTAMDGRVKALEDVSYVEITAAEVEAMFA